MSHIEPPKDWTTDECVGNQHYFGRPGSQDGFMIDIRVWALNSVHVWVPMCSRWCSFSIDEYKEIKAFLEAL